MGTPRGPRLRDEQDGRSERVRETSGTPQAFCQMIGVYGDAMTSAAQR